MHPIIDLHCDLLSYLAAVPGAKADDVQAIGAALPHLQAGGVKLQTLAIYTPTKNGSVAFAKRQLEAYRALCQEASFRAVQNKSDLENSLTSETISIVVAIENASGLCEEDQKLSEALKNLDQMIDATGRILYISLTHHPENRFGGGNYSDNVGLKEDGKILVDYLSGKEIAIDLSHTSDALAFDLLNYIDQRSLDIPIIASHSNFRPLWQHARNLPDELSQEIIRRKGLIGSNFLRAFIHPDDPEHLLNHLLYGFQELVAEDQLCFGADFFYRLAITDPDRQPLFFPIMEDATYYPTLLSQLKEKGITDHQLQQLAYKNVLNFINRIWTK